MNFERKAMSALLRWKESDSAKAMLVRGPRQVGKTFLINRFGQENYESFISVNLLERPELWKIFSGNLDPGTLVRNFSLCLPQARFIPGKTLLFLDEIQECPEAITSLKFWAIDGRYKVIGAGSMLGIDYKRPRSFPVGYVDFTDLYALSFEEFLWAAGIPKEVIGKLREWFLAREPVPEAVHAQLMKLLHLYVMTGGMPEAAKALLLTNRLDEADQIQQKLLRAYRYDIAHYAEGTIKNKAQDCFLSLPAQLSKPGGRFQCSAVKKGGTDRKYASSLYWLEQAFFVKPCYNVLRPEFPLRHVRDSSRFRVYPSDIGLLSAMAGCRGKAGLANPENTPETRMTAPWLYKTLAADFLIKNGHTELYFFQKPGSVQGADFLLPSDDGVLPVAVTAGNSRAKSLAALLQSSAIPYGYQLTPGNVAVSGKVITLPLYMGMFL